MRFCTSAKSFCTSRSSAASAGCVVCAQSITGPANSTKSLSIVVYQEAFSFQRAGSGASIALIVALISAVLTALYVTAMRRQAEVR